MKAEEAFYNEDTGDLRLKKEKVYGKATGVYGNTEVTKPSLSKMQKWKRAALTLPQKNTKIKAFKFHIDLKLMNTWKLETRLSSKFSKRRIIGPTRALKFSKRYNIQYF